MIMFRKLAIATTAAALLAGSATPALARPYGGWGGYHGGWHHYHHGGSGGALVGGLIVGGLIGALASSGRGRGPAPGGYVDGSTAQDRAADACGAAVEGDRGGRIREISNVAPYAGGWSVQGVVDVPADRPDSFSCTVRGGQVDDILYGSEYQPRR